MVGSSAISGGCRGYFFLLTSAIKICIITVRLYYQLLFHLTSSLHSILNRICWTIFTFPLHFEFAFKVFIPSSRIYFSYASATQCSASSEPAEFQRICAQD